jgi:hypothetical protein
MSDYTRVETEFEAKRILRDALDWIDGKCDKPMTNDFDAVALVSRALESCGIQ